MPAHHPVQVKRKMTNMFLVFEESDQLELGQLIDEFSTKVRELGATLKISDIHDI